MRRTQAGQRAARQFHASEEHFHVPWKHVEQLAGEGGESSASVQLVGWLNRTRRRAPASPLHGPGECLEGSVWLSDANLRRQGAFLDRYSPPVGLSGLRGCGSR